MNIFNKILRTDPTYVNIKDNHNILHLIRVTTQSNYAKLKFGKYRLMDNKEHFYKAQRLIHILSRFVQKVKMRKCKVYNIDCDLRMGPFETKTSIELVENRCVYRFNIYDLINIISAALLQQSFMFTNSQNPKNPYTNLNLSTHNLYNIYIQCLEKRIAIPEVIRRFQQCDFNVEAFKEKNRVFLLESAINSYFMPDLTVNHDVITYIYEMCYPYNIYIDTEFPRDKLYVIFRPYLKCYIRSKLLEDYEDIRYLLECFDLYNPYFGRRYIDDNNGSVKFDDRHLPFNEIKNGVFNAIKHTPIFVKCRALKYNCKDFQCISLSPISNVTYLDVYVEDHQASFECDDDNIDDIIQSDDESVCVEEDYDF